MISQAVSLNNLVVMRWFPPRNVNQRLSEEYRDEFARLEKLDLITKEEFHKRKWRPVALRTLKNYYNDQDATSTKML